jgi:phage regulator Rha-like protein
METTTMIKTTNQTMSSLEIAQIAEKRHNDVLKAIRKMEPAWEKVNEGKFSLVEYTDAKGEKRPQFLLTATECLYVAAKFNDETRARLVLRWEELEKANKQQKQLSENAYGLQENTVITVPMGKEVTHIYIDQGVIYTRLSQLMRYLGYQTVTGRAYVDRIGRKHFRQVDVAFNKVWFVNIEGYEELLRMTKMKIEPAKLTEIYRDVFRNGRPERDKQHFTYQFTDSEMLSIVMDISSFRQKSALVGQIMDKLIAGKDR